MFLKLKKNLFASYLVFKSLSKHQTPFNALIFLVNTDTFWNIIQST